MRLHSTSGVPVPGVRFLLLVSAAIFCSFAACGGDSPGKMYVVTGSGGSGTAGGSGSGGMATGGSVGTGGGTTGVGGAGLGGASGTGGDNGGTGGDTGADGGGIDAGKDNGVACSSESECASGYCVDGVCCDSACTSTCYTCAVGAVPGRCLPADVGTDPRNQCDDMGAATCQTNGSCDGNGLCRLYPAGTVCNTVPPACDATNTAVISSYVCDGRGTCGSSPTDCKGFRCSNAACESSCTSDATCAAGAFCGGGGCFASPYNLAGNGDLEYGTVNGWLSFAGAGAPILSSPGAAGFAHGGQYSIDVGGRTQNYQGPGYNIPTGPGQYAISYWALQQADDSLTGLVQIQLTCATTTQYVTVQSTGFGMNLPSGTWVQFTRTVDTSASATPADCDPTATPPGVLKRAILYLNQSSTGSPEATPDLFADDVVVQVTDGHNLIGNPNFEAGVTDGWAVAGMGTMAISSTIFNAGGTMSLGVTGRTTTASGPSYPLPIGGARYNVTFHALHTDATTAHDLILQPSYTCLGGTPTTTPPIDMEAAVAGNTWTTLSGTVTLPPLDAAPGCKLIAAEVHVEQEAGDCTAITCPDVYVDDASITIAP